MKKFTLFISLCLFMAVVTQAQEKEEPSMFFVIEEYVAPADMAKFWKAQSEALEIYDQLDANMVFNTFRTDRNSFFWSIPIKSFGCIDKLMETMMANHAAMLDKGFDATEKFRDLSTMSQFVVKWNKDLSYHPEGSGNNDSNTFYEWVFFYVKAGHEKELVEASKKYQEFYDGIEERYEWDIYEVVLGPRTPCWILAVSDESEAKLRSTEEALQKKYGKDFQKLWMNFVQHIDDMQVQKGWYMPAWSRTTNE